jgi:polyhydroxyalkanoate synthesis regulator phasin
MDGGPRNNRGMDPEIDHTHERRNKMDPKQIAKQMIQFNKTAFDNTFDAMTVLQEQTEKMVAMWMDQAPLVPAEGKKAINDWLKAYKKGRGDFKAAVDENYKKVEKIFASFDEAK